MAEEVKNLESVPTTQADEVGSCVGDCTDSLPDLLAPPDGAPKVGDATEARLSEAIRASVDVLRAGFRAGFRAGARVYSLKKS